MRISFFTNLVVFLIIILFITSCSESSINNNNSELSCNELISKINSSKEVNFNFNNDSIVTQVDVEETFYSLKCKKGKRIYRKKKFRLYPLKKDQELKQAELIVDLNNELKENKLIGVFSKIITLNNESYLFQEEMGKRIIESNYRREGIVLKITNQDSLTLVSSIKNKPFNPMLDLAIQNFIKNNILDECFIDQLNTIKFNEIVQKYLGNVKPNYFYLNPITNKAEPILSGLSNFKSNNIKKLVFKSCETDTSYLIFFKIKKEEAVLRLKENKTVLNERVIIPKGFTIEINAGQEIDIINNGSILSYSPIKCKGTLNDKIKIYSSDSSGQGVHIIQNNESSTIDHLVFSNQTSFTYRTKIMSWTLPSALTFYGGEIKISNSHFKDFHSEDAINTFRSKYSVRNSIVENTFSDAFDADFGYGIVDSCKFIDCGNDAVDISGGHLDLSNTYFTIVKDKAISAGEESEMNVSNCIIENTSLGIISKDLSKVSAYNTTLSNCEIAYCAFQKKGEFGPATIVSKKSKESDCKKRNLIEFKSTFSLNDSVINEFEYNVIDYLYGNIYGKATVK